MNLSYGRIETLLKFLHGVAPEKAIALKGRLNHFQRARFPPNVNVGRGPRAVYGYEATFELIFAFELLRLRVPPLTAVQIINANRRLFRRMLLLGWQAWIDTRRPPPTSPPPVSQGDIDPSVRPVAIISPDGLEDLRRQGRPSGEFDRVQIIEGAEIASWLSRGGPLPSPGLQIIDFMSVVGRALDAVVALELDDPMRDRASGPVRLNDLLDTVEAELRSGEQGERRDQEP